MSSLAVFRVTIGFIVFFLLYSTDNIGVGPGLGALLSTGLYVLMKVLDYEKVNGSQDRDDTLLVAQIIPRHETSVPEDALHDGPKVVGENGNQGDYFDNKEIIVTQVHKPGHGPLSPATTPGKEEV
jgi:hypothetical protein